MADKAVSELVPAEVITATDLFVLEQNGTAKKLPGQVLLNWLTAAADGHGGISKIEKLKTSGLADTYRITLADTTTFDFVVNNGKGISNIAKTSTSGLVDTYTITYNDGAKTTFTVTNGAKGDKGDNTYVWVKYASQEPTASSSSFGDLPDDWIGIYYGGSNTAPTDWQQYKWFKIKGEKGDTGAPATLISASVSYQVSDSGTIIPSGNWITTIPVVAQGKYLWTRMVQTFNTGEPVTAYTISRMGLDGLGSVVSVANISPDLNGNVPLTPADIGALSVNGGDMLGGINMQGQKLNGLNPPEDDNEAATKGWTEEQIDAITPDDIGALSMELLWSNASTSSKFPEQTISLNLGEYDRVLIEFITHVSADAPYGNCRKDAIARRNTRGQISGPGETGSYITLRCFTVDNNGVSFEAGYYAKTYAAETLTASNNSYIPAKIYGIKGVL